MGVTLSHVSALKTLRMLRSEGYDMREAESFRLGKPTPWVGKRWRLSMFHSPEWKWEKPSKESHLHILFPSSTTRIRMTNVDSHPCNCDLPTGSILWLDEYASIVSPELLFLQMAGSMSFPSLVMLGYELCGHFSRDALRPIDGRVTMELRPATSVEDLSHYIKSCSNMHGITQARRALDYIADYAASTPEALLATMYALPPEESGYGMGPITLNKRVHTDTVTSPSGKQTRLPDILFSFAPIGINYDGEDHLDLDKLVIATRAEMQSEVNQHLEHADTAKETAKQIRDKYVDDIIRNRQLLAHGMIVLPVTKEDLDGQDGLDNLTRHINACARTYFGVDTSRFEMTVDDTDRARDRQALLNSYLPGRKMQDSHGKSQGNKESLRV